MDPVWILFGRGLDPVSSGLLWFAPAGSGSRRFLAENDDATSRSDPTFTRTSPGLRSYAESKLPQTITINHFFLGGLGFQFWDYQIWDYDDDYDDADDDYDDDYDADDYDDDDDADDEIYIIFYYYYLF